MSVVIAKEDAPQVIAENLELIIRNHLHVDALERDALNLRPDEVFVNAHLIDRAGAIVNALRALGYEWDAEPERDWPTCEQYACGVRATLAVFDREESWPERWTCRDHLGGVHSGSKRVMRIQEVPGYEWTRS